MKKLLIITVLLLLTVALASCGGETATTTQGTVATSQTPAATTPDTAETLPTQLQTIEITPENWQEYFEIKYGFNFNKNPFGDIESVTSGMRIYIKPEYFDRLVSAEVHFDVYAENGTSSLYQYDLLAEELTIEPTTAGTLIPGSTITTGYAHVGSGSAISTYRYDQENKSDNVITDIIISSLPSDSGERRVYISESVARWTGMNWESATIKRTLGSITLKQS